MIQDKALDDVENQDSSSYEESTDEEWEVERLKQQAVFEKDQVSWNVCALSCQIIHKWMTAFGKSMLKYAFTDWQTDDRELPLIFVNLCRCFIVF